MVLARSALALTLASAACSVAHAAPAAKPVAKPPAASSADPDDIVAVQMAVAYHDVSTLASVLKDIFSVHPERGDVRAILHDKRAATLIVFATAAGHARVRRVLAGLLVPGPA